MDERMFERLWKWLTTSPLVPWLIFLMSLVAGCILVGAIAIRTLKP